MTQPPNSAPCRARATDPEQFAQDHLGLRGRGEPRSTPARRWEEARAGPFPARLLLSGDRFIHSWGVCPLHFRMKPCWPYRCPWTPASDQPSDPPAQQQQTSSLPVRLGFCWRGALTACGWHLWGVMHPRALERPPGVQLSERQLGFGRVLPFPPQCSLTPRGLAGRVPGPARLVPPAFCPSLLGL